MQNAVDVGAAASAFFFFVAAKPLADEASTNTAQRMVAEAIDLYVIAFPPFGSTPTWKL
jgi:hypothetical protein